MAKPECKADGIAGPREPMSIGARGDGPGMVEAETLTENELSCTVWNLVEVANTACGIGGAGDIVKLALERARRLLRLGGLEVAGPDGDGSVLPMVRRHGG